MVGKKSKHKSKRFLARHRYLKYFLVVLLSIVLLIAFALTFSHVRTSIRQSKLEPFYNTKGLVAKGKLGQIVRQEPLGVNLENGTATRILYRTQRANGSYTFSSGMIFVPNNANAGLPRPVVAWAHGTMGLGDQCAPTRTPNPVKDIAGINSMLAKGWVVTATDYAGFGTPGTQGYLVGGSEANDVLNSVRAARDLPSAKASNKFTVWGHSQGGSSALFTASAAAQYAPELDLVGTVASAPAAELVSLFSQQYNTLVDWVIGPILVTSWPAANSSLNAKQVTSSLGFDNYHRLANDCIGKSTIAGLIRNGLGQKFFSVNPMDVPAWRIMAEQQSAPVLAPNQPLMVVESENDNVVLPNTTALYIQTACSASSDLTSLWLQKASHLQIPSKSSAQVISWLNGRFNNQPTSPTCAQPLPVKPAANT